MRCFKCGKPMNQTGAESIKVSDGLFQTTRYYKCKCGNKQSETDEPVKV